MMAIPLSTGDSVEPGTPERLFDSVQTFQFDMSRNGQRFLTIEPAEAADSRVQINVELNWHEELKARVPVD